MNNFYMKLCNEIKKVNLNKGISKVEVPIYFVEERNDIHTPDTLLEEYYNVLDAPRDYLV